MPKELCALSRLQLLDLAHNPLLHPDGCCSLAQAPLHKVLNLHSNHVILASASSCFSQGGLSAERTSSKVIQAVGFGDIAADSSPFCCSWCPASGWTCGVNHICLPARFHYGDPLPLLSRCCHGTCMLQKESETILEHHASAQQAVMHGAASV